MMKALVTKEVAEAIEYLRNSIRCYRDDSYIITEHARIIDDEDDYWVDKSEPLNYVDVATFARAILNGYKVEMSPEEKVRVYYRDGETSTQEALGIRMTLNLLGIKIEGVND